MDDKNIKEEFEKWMNDPEMTKEESTFPSQFEDNEADETEFLAHGFYAGFRTAERLAKIEVLEEVLIDIRKEFPQYDRFLAGRGHENNIICGALECKINELKAGN